MITAQTKSNNKIMQDTDQLPWTGERFLPEIGGTIALEHIHRYEIAADFVNGKYVMDIASGEGYGSKILSRTAAMVTGVDIAEDAVTHANNKYASSKLEFKKGSCLSIPASDASYDVVVSFETIEHIAEHDQMMSEIKRILRPEGLLIISSPNKEVYTDAADYHNEHHVKELYKHEFTELIKKYFKCSVLLGQRVIYGSAIISDDTSHQFLNTKNIKNVGDVSKYSNPLSNPMYCMAFCSDQPISGIYSSILDQDLDSIDSAVSNRLFAQENKKLLDLVHSLQKNVGLLQGDNNNKQANIESLQGSLCWRITAPIRFIDGILNGNKH